MHQAKLAGVLELFGYRDVRAIISSGSVVFESPSRGRARWSRQTRGDGEPSILAVIRMQTASHSGRWHPATLALCVLVLWPTPLSARTHPTQESETRQATNQSEVRVRLSCDACDIEHLRESLDFVDVVPDGAPADVDVVVRLRPAPPDDRGLITITGLRRFADRRREIPFAPPPDAPDAGTREDLAARVRLGLVEFAAEADDAGRLDVTFARPDAEEPASAGQDQVDPWNYWVFRVGTGAFVSGESQTSSAYYSVSTSANRTTEAWKVRLSASRNLNTSSFTFDDETIESRLTDWSVNALVVRSLGPRWSMGVTGAVVGSTYDNSRRVVRLAPAIEFDVFPYAESSQRSLTLQYAVGWAHYEYEAETIFDRLDEHIGQHGLHGSLGLRQPWGQIGASAEFTQHLTAPDRTRTTVTGNANVRLARAVSLTTSASYARIRDQFTLEKGDASAEEVLLRQRQLATGYRYSFRVGLTYSFGALGNTTVNPRFGG